MRQGKQFSSTMGVSHYMESNYSTDGFGNTDDYINMDGIISTDVFIIMNCFNLQTEAG